MDRPSGDNFTEVLSKCSSMINVKPSLYLEGCGTSLDFLHVEVEAVITSYRACFSKNESCGKSLIKQLRAEESQSKILLYS